VEIDEIDHVLINEAVDKIPANPTTEEAKN
jgi:hypothetical protein